MAMPGELRAARERLTPLIERAHEVLRLEAALDAAADVFARVEAEETRLTTLRDACADEERRRQELQDGLANFRSIVLEERKKLRGQLDQCQTEREEAERQHAVAKTRLEEQLAEASQRLQAVQREIAQADKALADLRAEVERRLREVVGGR